jgi:signal transduction histidine kinase
MCEETSRVHGIEVECEASDVPRQVPEDIALCLYRVLQEGLNNAVRHGAAKRAGVRIEADDEGIRLTLRDEGSGFDPDGLESPGIGLAGMRERAHHFDGTFELHSRPGEGTRIEVRIPLPEESA